MVAFVVVAAAMATTGVAAFVLRDSIRRHLNAFAHKHPALHILTVLIPLNVALSLAVSCRNGTIRLITGRHPLSHERRVQNVQRQVLDWNRTGKKGMMCTLRSRNGVLGALGARLPRYKRVLLNVHLSMDDVLSIDYETKIARVEPMLLVADLVSILLKNGHSLSVAPETADITVGGAILGAGFDASSGRSGFFHSACLAYEVIMPDGRLVRATATDNPELFACIPMSHGSLGVLVAVELKIAPVPAYVHLEYIPMKTRVDLVKLFAHEAMRSATADGPLFVEAFVYGDTEGVVVTGEEMGDDVSTDPIHAIGHFYAPWFYEHARSHIATGRSSEIVYRTHFHGRHRRSRLFEAADTVPFGNSLAFRLALGWTAPIDPRVVGLLRTDAAHLQRTETHIAQTYVVPITELAVVLDAIDKELKVHPLWLCPLRVPSESSRDALVQPRGGAGGDEMHAVITVWGRPAAETYRRRESLRAVASVVRACGGFQLVCGDSAVVESKAELTANLNTRTFDRTRDKTGCFGAFPDPFDKMCMAAKAD